MGMGRPRHQRLGTSLVRPRTRGRVCPHRGAGRWPRPLSEGPTEPLHTEEPHFVFRPQRCSAERPEGRTWEPGPRAQTGATPLTTPASSVAVRTTRCRCKGQGRQRKGT